MKHNQYLQKTLFLSIILGVLPIMPVLGFSPNSFISNSFTTTTTTKPINLISNISPVSNLQSYTNTTNSPVTTYNPTNTNTNYSTNFYVQNNSVSSFQSPVSTTTKPINLISNISQVSNLQSYTNTTNSPVTTYNPINTNTSYIPQNNTNYSANFYVQNNSITQLQSTIPSSPISTNISTFPNVVAYTSPIANNTYNIFNTTNLNTIQETNLKDSTPTNSYQLLFNNNQLLTNTSQSTQSSLNSFQLFKPLDINILTSNTQSQTKEAQTKEGDIIPQGETTNLIPEIDPIREIILIIAEDSEINNNITDKIISWKAAYGYQTIILNKSQFANVANLKSYLIDFKQQHPNFQYLILPINSLKGTVSFTNNAGKTFTIDSDYYFANLDNDANYIPEIYVSRASLSELASISQRRNLPSLKSLIALPIIQYDHWLGCWDGYCMTTWGIDPSDFGEGIVKNYSRQAGITNIVTLYETEGLSPAENKPTFSLNLENVNREIQDSNFVTMLSTREIVEVINPGKDDFSVVYQDHLWPTRAIWVNNKTPDRAASEGEIEIQEFGRFSSSTNYHRIGVIPIFNNVDLNLNSFSSIIGINNIKDKFWGVKEQLPNNDIWKNMSNTVWGNRYWGRGGSGKDESLLTIIGLATKNTLLGQPVAKSVFNVYNQYNQMFPGIADRYEQKYWALSLFVRGDPTLTIQDLTPQPHILLEPTSVLTTGIDLGYDKGSFTITNIGEKDLNWNISQKPNWISIEPESGVLSSNNTITVNLKIRNPIPEFGSLSTAKPRSGYIYLSTNDSHNSLIRIKVLGKTY